MIPPRASQFTIHITLCSRAPETSLISWLTSPTTACICTQHFNTAQSHNSNNYKTSYFAHYQSKMPLTARSIAPIASCIHTAFDTLRLQTRIPRLSNFENMLKPQSPIGSRFPEYRHRNPSNVVQYGVHSQHVVESHGEEDGDGADEGEKVLQDSEGEKILENGREDGEEHERDEKEGEKMDTVEKVHLNFPNGVGMWMRKGAGYSVHQRLNAFS